MSAPVLLVDDSSANLFALEAALASAGHELVVARSGREALRLVEQRDFAVVLLDLQMPEMDGFETAARMRQIARPDSPLPVIFVSGFDTDPARVRRAYGEGGVDFIQKPLEPAILRAKVAIFSELYLARQRLISARRTASAETARREAAENNLSYLRAVIDNLPELAWTALADGQIDFYNRRWFEFTGTTLEEMTGWGWQKVHDPELLPAVVERWKRALATGEVFEMEFPLRGRDGAFRWFLTRVTPLRDAEGNVLRWVGINTDIDARRHAERARDRALQEAERQRAAAERAVRAREDLLAIVSHDLRNPLSIMLLVASQIELLADETTRGQRLKKAADALTETVDEMSRLVGDLLDLARLEAGQLLAIETAAVDVAELTRQATERLEPLARARGLSLMLTLEAEAEARMWALCDRGRVAQVLSNLIGNALKFTLEGGEIDVEVRRAGPEVLVTVKDTGIGIAADQLADIFKPYWQADARRKEGAGLGLSIAKAIVDAHGGRIWVETGDGKGSHFYFTLPATDARPATEDRA